MELVSAHQIRPTWAQHQPGVKSVATTGSADSSTSTTEPPRERDANNGALQGLPVLVTEHGADLDDSQDHRRAAFIEASLRELASAIADGVDVRGYLHWSLMDNWEWFKGYEGCFGLLGVDRTTQRRSIRPSATVLGAIARANLVAAR